MKLSDLKVGMIVEHQNKYDQYSIESVGSDWFVYKQIKTRIVGLISNCGNSDISWISYEVKPKIKRWINIYPDKYLNMTVGAFDSKQLANRASVPNRIACIEIEFSEGEGLDK